MAPDPTVPPAPVSSAAAPLARRGIARRRLRVVQRAQQLVVAAALLATAVAWAEVMRLAHNHRDEPWLLAVPALLIASAAAVFARGLWAVVLVRAALWAGFVCAVVFAFLDGPRVHAAPLGIAAGVGLLFLGRFSRAFGGARPLLVALVVLAVSDAVIHGLIAVFVALDGGARDISIVAVCGFAALANAVGLAFLLGRANPWPHVLGNATVAALVACDLLDAPAAINVPMVGAAALQIALALAQRLPRARPGARRAAEWGVRVVLAVAIALFLSL